MSRNGNFPPQVGADEYRYPLGWTAQQEQQHLALQETVKPVEHDPSLRSGVRGAKLAGGFGERAYRGVKIDSDDIPMAFGGDWWPNRGGVQ